MRGGGEGLPEKYTRKIRKARREASKRLGGRAPDGQLMKRE
jgi:hypothetical protein